MTSYRHLQSETTIHIFSRWQKYVHVTNYNSQIVLQSTGTKKMYPTHICTLHDSEKQKAIFSYLPCENSSFKETRKGRPNVITLYQH